MFTRMSSCIRGCVYVYVSVNPSVNVFLKMLVLVCCAVIQTLVDRTRPTNRLSDQKKMVWLRLIPKWTKRSWFYKQLRRPHAIGTAGNGKEGSFNNGFEEKKEDTSYLNPAGVRIAVDSVHGRNESGMNSDRSSLESTSSVRAYFTNS